ncbi:MAG: hypothetical protein QOE77_957 [Blastocatellia bacterium]|jgi:YD repeat-containing protein|nr:hypothetical protein [Blastocatellia bacterium]
MNRVTKFVLTAFASLLNAHHTAPGLTGSLKAVLIRRWAPAMFLLVSALSIGSVLAVANPGFSNWLLDPPHSPQHEISSTPDKHASFRRILQKTQFGSRPETQQFLAWAAPALVIDTPTNLNVYSAASGMIRLSWNAPAGSVDHYQIERSQSLAGPFLPIGNSTTTNFDDTTVSSINSYLYRARSIDAFGAPSQPSNMAVGTALSFLDAELQAGVTVIRRQHITELRQAINAVRGLAGLSAATWTHDDLTGALIYAADIQELRDKLTPALAALNVPASAYQDGTLVATTTPVKKVHIDQLRERATRGSSTSSGPIDSGTASPNARLDPMNRTGEAGEDPFSRNFNWSLPIVSLPGRNGFDLGLSLSYNSLATWTRNGSYVSFDDDRGSPGPGFRLGLPVIQAAYYNAQAGKNAFLLISPSGTRTELQQVGASSLYQSVDSSYLLLDASTMKLRTTEGKQLSFEWKGSDYQCTQIKDRNGNYISVNYDTAGRLDTVVDTLARSIKFNYTTDGLSTITQTWQVNGQTQTHTWASFTYASQTIQTTFPGLSVFGPQNNTSIHVLAGVTVADGSRVAFDYSSWGQVWKIRNYAADDHLLNYVSYNLPQTNAAAQTDCPRFTERHEWAENWNKDVNGTEQEVITSFTAAESATWTMPSGAEHSGMMAQVTLPDNTYHRFYAHSSGWDKGFTILTKSFDSAGNWQRQSASDFTQDNTGVAYPLNPRRTETNIYDPAGNRARSRVTYASFNLDDGTIIYLPQDLYEYQANASTVMRRTHTDYVFASAYTTRRILGLLSETSLYEIDASTSGETLMTKVSFAYDESGSIQGNDAPVQHDSNYGASFITGRGNLTGVRRYDVGNTSQFTASSMKFNTAGAVVAATDPLSHQVSISYTDAFAADGTTLDPSLSFTTLAYPTLVTDAGGYSSSTRYSYDFGAATWTQTPQPNTTQNLPGPEQKITFDSIGRLSRITNLTNDAYERYEYSTSQTRVDKYVTIQEGLGEAHSFSLTDGLGRVLAIASQQPGSVGGFSGQLTVYDGMGRAIKTSNPTETSASGAPSQWVATGDDATGGWVYTQQTYDWKGRPLVTTNTDLSTKSLNYGGCGCAGGEVVTLTDELGRAQKRYSDVIGRITKTEVLNWNGTVYSATLTNYNARDQVKLVNAYAGEVASEGSCPSGTCQQTVMTYDGYGRLKTKHVPQHDSGAVTSWDYNSDDTVQKVTDARGASATYSYTNRKLVNDITYSAPSGITATSVASFSYDAVGNRTGMTDGSGNVSYSYNALSRLASETRQFSGLSGSYSLNYDYNLMGQLKSVTDPTGAIINYSLDAVGRLSGVSGSSYGGVTQYASNMEYRASGAAKSMLFGNSRSLSATYNGRLQVSHFEITNVMSKDYQYGADGQVSYSADLVDNRFDRSYSYDHAARITQALSGPAARGEADSTNRPYKMFYQYDALNHLLSRTGSKAWSGPILGFNDSYVNNRNPEWSYDASGMVLNSGREQYTYDAAGRAIVVVTDEGDRTHTSTFDGDGLRTKAIESQITYDDLGNPTTTTTTSYHISSSVLGRVVTDLDQTGQKTRSFVYAGGQVMAWQEKSGTTESVLWEYRDPSNASYRMASTSVIYFARSAELEPQGTDAGTHNTYPQLHRPPGEDLTYPGFVELLSGRCTIDGVPAPCDMTTRLMQSGTAVQCPNNDCGPQRYELTLNGAHTSGVTNPFSATSDWSGYLPSGMSYVGDGIIFNSFWTGGRSEKETFGGEGYSGGASFFMQPRGQQTTTTHKPASLQPFAQTSLPQNTLPINIRSIPNKDQAKGLVNSLNIAKEHIRKNPHCAALFGKSVSDLIAMLDATEYRVLDLGRYTFNAATLETSVTGAQTASATDVHINKQGPFFNNQMFIRERGKPVTLDFHSGLRGAAFGALLLLHELGHQTGIFGSDRGDPDKNLGYTQRVKEACF